MNSIKAQIITIGDEILYGQITDTNTQWISAELDKIGVKTSRKLSVGDDAAAIAEALQEAANNADIVVVTGGLGPTKDDITKKIIIQLLDDKLVINEDALAFLTDFFAKRGRELTELNRQQAALPSTAEYLPNTMGTAPGMWFTLNGASVISLPGVPYEMKNLMQTQVIPRINERYQTPVIVHRSIRTAGVGESFLAEQIADWEDALPPNIKLAYLPGPGQVKLRLTGFGDDETVVDSAIQAEIAKVLPMISKFVFSLTDEPLEQAVGRLLLENNATVSTAESCTGGYLSHLFTSVPGSSAYFEGGIISYSNNVKMNELGVKPETLEQHGAVSAQTVTEMAEGVRQRLKTTYGLATSGVAGPGGGTPEKPVGLVYIAVASSEKTVVLKLNLISDRQMNIQYSSLATLNLLRLVIEKEK